MAHKVRIKRIGIEGMHCRSCELLIENSLGSVPGVTGVRVDHAEGTAHVSYDGNEPDDAIIRRAIEDAGYGMSSGGTPMREPFFARDFSTYAELAIALGILFILFVVADRLSLFDLSFEFGPSPRLSVVALVGAAAGVSTCMAIVGGLVLGVSARYSELHPDASAADTMKPHLLFNLGRIMSFFLLGGAIGSLGSVFTVSGTLFGILIVAVGAVMAWLGLKLIDVSPRISAWGFGLPAGVARALGLNRNAREYSHGGAFATGALTFFLPCGFTQAMQLYAVSTGSFLSGALIMSVFALGTAPGLLGAAGLASVARGTWGKIFFKGVGVAVIVLGLWNVRSGLVFAGVTFPGFAGAEGAAAELKDGVQIVRMEQRGNGYVPNRFTVRQGIPVRWIIDSKSPYTCAAFIQMRDYDVSKYLEPGENVIEFVPRETGTIGFSCSMGMYAGVFTVI